MERPFLFRLLDLLFRFMRAFSYILSGIAFDTRRYEPAVWMEAPANPHDAPRTPRIVIADDFETLRQGLKSILGSAICGEAENGQEAIQRVLELHPDMVILDWTMPVMGGLEAARTIRSLAPEIKIVVFSLHNANAIREEALKAGADVFLHKTTKVDDLLETIADLLRPMGLDLSMAFQSGSDAKSRPAAAR